MRLNRKVRSGRVGHRNQQRPDHGTRRHGRPVRDKQTREAVSHQDDWAFGLADLGSEFGNPDSAIGRFPVGVLEFVKALFFPLPDCLPMFRPRVKKSGKNKKRGFQAQVCVLGILGAQRVALARVRRCLTRSQGPAWSAGLGIGPPVRLNKVQEHDTKDYNKPKGRLLTVPHLRLPHQKPLPAHGNKSCKPQDDP